MKIRLFSNHTVDVAEASRDLRRFVLRLQTIHL